jgi:hypothetical protein
MKRTDICLYLGPADRADLEAWEKRTKVGDALRGRRIMAVSSRRQFSVEKRICDMSETNITQLHDPLGFSSDPFTDVLSYGVRKLIEHPRAARTPLP